MRKILKSLFTYYGTGQRKSVRHRIKKLAAMICGMMRRKRSTYRAMGSGLPQFTTAHNKEKSAKLFLESYWVDFETFYQPYIIGLLKKIAPLLNQRFGLQLTIDGSQLGNEHTMLMISIYFRGRSIPLVWLVERKPKGHFDCATHLRLIKKAYAIIQQVQLNDKITLSGDGEFDGTDLIDFCKGNGWNYSLRTSCNSVFYENDNRFQSRDVEANPQQNFTAIANVEFTEKRIKEVHFVLWHDAKRYEEPIPIVSSFNEPIDAIEAYDRRYSVECLFKDMKSTTFNIHQTRIEDTHAIANLVMIASFALTLLWKLALKYDKIEWRKRIHRWRNDRKVCSLTTFGRDLLDYLLEEDIDFCFSFQFSKNSS